LPDDFAAGSLVRLANVTWHLSDASSVSNYRFCLIKQYSAFIWHPSILILKLFILIKPNTTSSHRLLWWAEQRNQQDALAEALFKAYFSEGRDVGRHDVLAEIASETGLPKAEASLQVFSTCLEPTVDPEKDPAVASPQRHRKRSPDCPAGAIPIEAQRPQSLWEAQPEM
jgi:DSBA-like thioredoxin domain